MSNLYVRGVAYFIDRSPVVLIDKYEDAILHNHMFKSCEMKVQDSTYVSDDINRDDPRVADVQLCIEFDGDLYEWIRLYESDIYE